MTKREAEEGSKGFLKKKKRKVEGENWGSCQYISTQLASLLTSLSHSLFHAAAALVSHSLAIEFEKHFFYSSLVLFFAEEALELVGPNN